MGVSDFLMTTLAKGTVMVGKKVGSAISESDVSCLFLRVNLGLDISLCFFVPCPDG